MEHFAHEIAFSGLEYIPIYMMMDLFFIHRSSLIGSMWVLLLFFLFLFINLKSNFE